MCQTFSMLMMILSIIKMSLLKLLVLHQFLVKQVSMFSCMRNKENYMIFYTNLNIYFLSYSSGHIGEFYFVTFRPQTKRKQQTLSVNKQDQSSFKHIVTKELYFQSICLCNILFNQFFIWLLYYSVLLKTRNDHFAYS